ncbi:hypothetical protein [Bacillus subtilis]
MEVIIIEGPHRQEIQGDSNIPRNKRSRDRASTASSRPV